MNKAIISAGVFLCLATAAHTQEKLPKTGKPLPPVAPAVQPQKPVYWSSYFDDMFDDTMDVDAAANARSVDEISRDGWNKNHGVKETKPKAK